MPKVSIIVVSYNSLYETTFPCIESIFARTKSSEFEVIVVDNNSSDSTPAYLTRLGSREPRLKYILNKSNRGFAGGNNDGIKTSNGKYLVLLNNDTIVTENWLERLIPPLCEDKTIGIVGPVSNAVGNEQLIYIKGESLEEIIGEGYFWSSMSKGDRFETDMLSFFCIAMRRDVVNTVGLLDEDYGLGYFEDDDYCIRVKRAGYKLVCVEDVFVYHEGAKSFNKIHKTTRALLKKNKKLLEDKFNIKYCPSHPRERQFNLLASYIERAKKEGLSDGLSYKINNRFLLLEQIMPRGLFKKLHFSQRLNHLRKLLESI